MKYEIVGDTLPVVICHLNKGEKMISDSGAMASQMVVGFSSAMA